MRSRNEADTRAELIEPKLRAAGWTGSRVTREYFFQRDHDYTRGRIFLVGNDIRRGEKQRADYVLLYTDGLAIAAVEAKPETDAAESGLEQAKRYSAQLGLAFAYTTNGHEIIEYDFFTSSSREITAFPSPEALWSRWVQNTALADRGDPDQVAEARRLYGPQAAAARRANPLLHDYCPESVCGKSPHYFQEVAIREVIKRAMRGQRRVLLTMATGSGKTFVSFQIAWKLVKSGWLQRQHPSRPARVLFLTDRVVLRGQACNDFSPFADGTSDPRLLLEGFPANLHRDLYFAIYQTLWSPDESGRRLFEHFPRDFFDLIIIDECHRSGWGTWREILDHFGEAIHLGMTATPKQTESIDTYSYFCAEEPEVLIDPDHPERGAWRAPAYQYSFGQGIDDGFLSTYKVHRVRTTVDATGLRLEDAIEQGAEVFIPEDVSPQDEYHTPEFERTITLPDRTETMVHHLASLLRRFGHLDRTMVFCVDMEHARLVARLLQDEFGPLTGMDDYAVPIISEEGEEGRRWLESFADSDKRSPVVATTAELLSTGVDVPACRNIVFMKTVSSPLVFKQIVGRGSRQDPDTDKYWFRIIDYTGATRLFDDWERLPVPPPTGPVGPLTAVLQGTVFHAETEDLIVGARVSVLTGPNSQQGPILTGGEGAYRFTSLPAGTLKLMVSASGFIPREIAVETIADETTTCDAPLKPQRKARGKIRVKGIEVAIADEALLTIEATGQQLTLLQYQDHVRAKVIEAASTRPTLRDIWVDSERRGKFMQGLRASSIHPELVAELLGQPDADAYDMLAHIAFGDPIHTRSERAAAFRNREQLFITRHAEDARKVILELLDKYRAAGVEELRPEVFGVSPFRDWGGAVRIADWFGGVRALGQSLLETVQRLYPA